MLMHYNNTISIQRFVLASGSKTRSEVKTGYNVYLQPRGEKVVTGLDSQGAYKEYMLMTDGIFEIKIGDKITDSNSKKYIVNGGQIFNDITGTHGQYILFENYE